MKSTIIILFFCSFLFTNCENTIDIYEAQNESPIILVNRLGSNDEFVNSLIDSFRISNESYNLRIRINDKQYLSKFIFEYYFTYGSGELNIIDSTISFIPDNIGINNFSIKATDPYGLSGKVNLSVFAFNNLSPIAKFFIDEQESKIIFNASESFDQDRNFGGEISKYKFTIGNSSPILWDYPILEFNGLEITELTLVRLQVKDNNDIWSEEYTQIYYP